MAHSPGEDDRPGNPQRLRKTREKILAAYRASPEAIASMIEYLQDMYESELRAVCGRRTVAEFSLEASRAVQY